MPLTIGAAFDVPLLERYVLGEPNQAATMSEPGAKRSTHGPWFEYRARISPLSIAPTEMTAFSDAGEYRQASRFWFPAAPTTMRPSAIIALTASLNTVDLGMPTLRFTIAGTPGWWCAMIQSIAGYKAALDGCELRQFSTRTGTMRTSLAMP